MTAVVLMQILAGGLPMIRIAPGYGDDDSAPSPCPVRLPAQPGRRRGGRH